MAHRTAPALHHLLVPNAGAGPLLALTLVLAGCFAPGDVPLETEPTATPVSMNW